MAPNGGSERSLRHGIEPPAILAAGFQGLPPAGQLCVPGKSQPLSSPARQVGGDVPRPPSVRFEGGMWELRWKPVAMSRGPGTSSCKRGPGSRWLGWECRPLPTPCPPPAGWLGAATLWAPSLHLGKGRAACLRVTVMKSGLAGPALSAGSSKCPLNGRRLLLMIANIHFVLFQPFGTFSFYF